MDEEAAPQAGVVLAAREDADAAAAEVGERGGGGEDREAGEKRKIRRVWGTE